MCHVAQRCDWAQRRGKLQGKRSLRKASTIIELAVIRKVYPKSADPPCIVKLLLVEGVRASRSEHIEVGQDFEVLALTIHYC
ncbi:hypothetical protein KP2612_001330 [Komagataella phaffii]